MLSRLTLIFCLLLSPCAQAQPAPINEAELLRAFPSVKLERMQVGDEAGHLYCVPNACRLLAKEADEKDDPEFLTTHAIELEKGDGTVVLDCNGGTGPHCQLKLLWQYEKDRYGWGLDAAADAYVVPGDGCIYALRVFDADHRYRRKFCWKYRELIEMQQPFSYIGVQSTANVPLQLHPAPADRRVLHTIEPGAFVEILVASLLPDGYGASEWLLVRDRFGLTGWVSVESLGGDNACLSGRPLGIKGFCHSGS